MDIKFTSHSMTHTVYLQTETGENYRTNPLGDDWERKYGESWQLVGSDETQFCNEAYMIYLNTHSLSNSLQT